MTGIPRVNIEKACIGNNCKLEINFNLQDNAHNTNNNGEQDQAVGRNGFVRTGTFFRQEEDEAMIKIKNDSTDETLNIEEEYESESESDTEINTNYNGLVKNLGFHYKGLGAKMFNELSTHNRKRKYANGPLKVKKKKRFKQMVRPIKCFLRNLRMQNTLLIKYQQTHLCTLWDHTVNERTLMQQRVWKMAKKGTARSILTVALEIRGGWLKLVFTMINLAVLCLLDALNVMQIIPHGHKMTMFYQCTVECLRIVRFWWRSDKTAIGKEQTTHSLSPHHQHHQPFSELQFDSYLNIGHDKQQERLGGADRPQTREQTSTRNTNNALKQIPDSNMGTSDSVTTGAGQARQATKESEDVEGPQQIRSAKYLSKDARVKSFSGFDNLISQNRLQMAEAGFYYTGSADLVCCFHCGIGIQNWNNGDDPWVEHARWSSRCEYVRNIKGENFIVSVQNKHQQDVASRPWAYINLNPTRRENSPGTDNSFGRDAEILVVLQEMGFSVKKAREAILAVRQQTGSTVVDIGKAVTLLLDGEERRTSTTTSAGGIATTCMQATDSLQSEIIPSGSSINDLTASRYRYLSPKSIKAEKRREEQIMCKVCLDNTVCIVFYPCAHSVTCADCGPAIKKCPICQAPVRDRVRTYL